MTDEFAPVMPIRPGPPARYGDAQAMNDIHALLTSQDGPHGDEVPALVAEIAARTRRSLARAQVITAKVVQGAYGLPVALVDADGTAVSVGQQIGGAGVLIQVTTNNADEAGRLIVSVNGLVQRLLADPAPAAPRRPRPRTRTRPVTRKLPEPDPARKDR